MKSSFFEKYSSNQLLIGFMLLWFLINALQAHFLGLEADEAYYWYLSQNLDWSYFDHPPMVTLLIRLGESIAHGTLFTRLGTVIITTLSIGVIYKMLPAYLQNIRWYMLLCSATVILNVYSFITTPDAPLLFFAALFLLGYKYFLQKNNIANSLLMAIAITGMFYSKYHGILLVGFVVLSNLRLLLNKYFWLVVLLVTLFFLPHIYWQYEHNWPSFRFHLNERLARGYRINYTTDYLLGQLLIWGPFISLFFYATFYKLKIKDQLIRSHVFIFFGTLLFFLLSSFKNTVEAHWTLIAAPSYMVLFLWLLQNGTDKYRRLFTRFAIANLVLILVARTLFLIPHSPFEKIKNYRPFFHGKAWAKEVHKYAGNTPIVFESSYALPSLYMYYNDGVRAIGYNTKNYRKTNFNLQDDCILSGKKVFSYTGKDTVNTGLQRIETVYMPGTLIPIEKYTCVNALRITPVKIPEDLKANTTYTITIDVVNESDNQIELYNPLSIDYAFFIAKYNFINSDKDYPIEGNSIAPREKRQLQIELKTPEKPGKYKILFSVKNGIFTGNFAGAFYPVIVE